MRLIDADAFKKVLSEHEMEHDKRRSFDDYACGAANAYEYASDLLDEMPTLERPHGEWMWKEYDHDYDCGDIVCSKCSVVIYEGVSQSRLKVVKWPFCPDCGADMRKEGDEK